MYCNSLRKLCALCVNLFYSFFCNFNQSSISIYYKSIIMKTISYVFIIALLAGSFALLSCNSSGTKASTEKTVAQKEVYSCEMHPEVISDKPGRCPKCGMELTKKMVADTTKVTIQDSLKK